MKVERRFAPADDRARLRRTPARRCACWPACSPSAPFHTRAARATRACTPADGAGRDPAARDGRGRPTTRRASAACGPRRAAPRDRAPDRGPERSGEERRPARRPRGGGFDDGRRAAPRPATTPNERWRRSGAPIAFERGLASVRAVPARGVRGARCPATPRRPRSWSERPSLTGAAPHDRGCGAQPDPDSASSTCWRGWVHRRRSSRSNATELGEPVGTLEVAPGPRLVGTTVDADELPAGDRRGAGPGDRGRARERSDAVPGRRRAPAQGERPAAAGSRRRSARSAATAELEGDDLIVGGGGLAGGEARRARGPSDGDGAGRGALGAEGPVSVRGDRGRRRCPSRGSSGCWSRSGPGSRSQRDDRRDRDRRGRGDREEHARPSAGAPSSACPT